MRRYEGELLNHLHHGAKGVYDSIAGGKALSDDQAEALKAAADKYKKSFLASDGPGSVNEEDPGALAADEVNNEEIKVRKS